MLVKKKVFGFKPLGELSLGEVNAIVADELGTLLCNGTRFRKDSDIQDSLKLTLNEVFSETISINTDSIVYEASIPIADYNITIARAFMQAELNKIDTDRLTEYKNYVDKLCIENLIHSIDLKIVKIGVIDYVFYTL